jgi:hypothetical protein
MTEAERLRSSSGLTTMTEAEWRACRFPSFLLEIIQPRCTPRKLQLFLAACLRRLPHLTLLANHMRLAELIEALAEGLASQEEVTWCQQEAKQEVRPDGRGLWALDGSLHGRFLWSTAFSASQVLALQAVCGPAPRTTPGFSGEPYDGERRTQSELLRDLFGNPFRRVPSVSSALLTWNDRLVERLAQSAYEERAFERLPILADALEDAGCTDRAILDHCRGPGPHVRGCWVVDLILGKT